MPAAPAARERVRPGRRPPGPQEPPYDEGGRRGGDAPASPADAPASPAAVGVWLLVGTVAILFASFTSTLVVRRAEPDWQVGPVPPLLWGTTAVLLASSAALEWARRRGRSGDPRGLRHGLAAAAALGGLFLTGQVAAWRQVLAGGVGLATGPHASFFYLLTGAHAVHVAGGLAALAYVASLARRAPAAALATSAPVGVYWHFVDGLWLYVFLVLFAL